MEFKYLKYCVKSHLSIFFTGGGLPWCLIRLRFLPRVPSLPALAQTCTFHGDLLSSLAEGGTTSNIISLLKEYWKNTFSRSYPAASNSTHLPPSSPGPTQPTAPRCVCWPHRGWAMGTGGWHTHTGSLPFTSFHPVTDLPAPEYSSAKWFLHPKQSAQQQPTQKSPRWGATRAPQFAAGTLAQP